MQGRRGVAGGANFVASSDSRVKGGKRIGNKMNTLNEKKFDFLRSKIF
jgi:hypothetical protein